MKTFAPIILTGLYLVSIPVIAGGYAKNYSDSEFYDYARVTNVEPILETFSYHEPQRECHYENRVVHKGNGSKTPIILGSLIGGAIGNELGHNKSNKRVGAVAGAILGGSIARDISRSNGSYSTRRERICTTTEQVRYKEEITGYNVDYKYRGRTYSTIMSNRPDSRIKVAVSVQTAED